MAYTKWTNKMFIYDYGLQVTTIFALKLPLTRQKDNSCTTLFGLRLSLLTESAACQQRTLPGWVWRFSEQQSNVSNTVH